MRGYPALRGFGLLLQPGVGHQQFQGACKTSPRACRAPHAGPHAGRRCADRRGRSAPLCSASRQPAMIAVILRKTPCGRSRMRARRAGGKRTRNAHLEDLRLHAVGPSSAQQERQGAAPLSLRLDIAPTTAGSIMDSPLEKGPGAARGQVARHEGGCAAPFVAEGQQ